MTRPTVLCVGLLFLLSLFFSEDKPDGFSNVLAIRPFVSLKDERLVTQSTASAMLPSWATRNQSFWLISWLSISGSSTMFALFMLLSLFDGQRGLLTVD